MFTQSALALERTDGGSTSYTVNISSYCVATTHHSLRNAQFPLLSPNTSECVYMWEPATYGGGGSERKMVLRPRKVPECYIWYGKLPYLWDRTGSWWILVVGKDEEGECAELRVLQGQMELRSASLHLLIRNSTVKNEYHSLRALVVPAPVFLDIVCPYNEKILH